MKKEKKDYVQELKSKLNLIGFDIKGVYPNRFIYNDLGERTNWRVFDDRIDLDNDDIFGGEYKGSVCFYFEGSKIRKIDENCISLGTKHCFVNFENFDLTEPSKK